VDRRAALVVLVGTLVAVLFAAITTAGEVPLADGPPSIFDDAEPGRLSPPPPPTEIVESETIEERDDQDVSPWVERVARLIGWGSLAVAAVITTVVLWRTRPTFERWRRRRALDQPMNVLPDVVATVAAGAEEQRAALRRGAPRNAIVECWLLLETAVVDSGIPPRPADTSTELVERVLARPEVDAAALEALASLYREARFSDHEMSEASRRAAIGALDAVHDGLHGTTRGHHGSAAEVVGP